MPRTKGAKNKKRKPATKSVHVRLAAAEITALKAIHVSPGKAIHELIKRSYE